MFEERIGGVIGAEGRANGGNGDTGRLTIVPDERHDFFAQIRIEHGLNVAAMKWVCALVVKAEAVNGVDGEKFQFAGIDEISKRANQRLPFQFPLISRAGGKPDKRRAPVAVDHDAELETQSIRIPAVKFTFHRYDLA